MPASLADKVNASKLLMVGAGGIGCELLKNLVLSGFKDITVIDLDTIDVTNLNRQFLFHKQHVGMSKSKVARESALKFVGGDADIKALHGSVMTSEYGVNFFKQFTVVLNALDNRAARSHVNRMCLAADVPLVESGTAGYLGQVTVIKKQATECYDCHPKPHQKSFPGCTIRNTPSEPIHCIVWSKHLFNQLFGEADPDEDVSPDTEDPELAAAEKEEESSENGKDKEKEEDKKEGDGGVTRVNTRQWAIDNNHDPKIIFSKLFHDDIKYLLSMEKLWAKRKPPVPLDWDNLEGKGKESETTTNGGIRDQAQWTLQQCADVFASAVNKLSAQLKKSDFKDHLVWDKDDEGCEGAMDFVAACANIRCHVFGIPPKTRFDIKSMAGNIIPAIATTNAVIAGCIVMEAIKIIQGRPIEDCKMVFMARKPNPRHKILVPCELPKPVKNCFVCMDKPEVSVRLDLSKVTKKTLEDKILKQALGMLSPDAEIDGKGVVLIDSEEAEEGPNEAVDNKVLKEFGLADGSVLSCDDFLQQYQVKVYLYQTEDLPDGVEFEVVGDIEKLKEDQKKEKEDGDKAANGTTNGADKNGHSKEKTDTVDSDDDIVALDDDEVRLAAKKRSLESGSSSTTAADTSDATGPPVKKAKTVSADDDIVCIE